MTLGRNLAPTSSLLKSPKAAFVALTTTAISSQNMIQ
jgi:hypothetical protein